MVCPTSFAAWKDEAFELWLSQWKSAYTDDSKAVVEAPGDRASLSWADRCEHTLLPASRLNLAGGSAYPFFSLFKFSGSPMISPVKRVAARERGLNSSSATSGDREPSSLSLDHDEDDLTEEQADALAADVIQVAFSCYYRFCKLLVLDIRTKCRMGHFF